ncbi:MAG: YqgE/AlgH family protein [Pseudomonadota bacterium]
MRIPRKADGNGEGLVLDGQLLIAMPGMADKRFAGSVIYVCAHSDEGAMGLIINQRANHIAFADLLEQLELTPEDPEARARLEGDDAPLVQIGGPVETGRGFVLHTADYFLAETTMQVEDEICLTATVEILRSIAQGKGPRKAIMALGYAGWSPGQLEAEIGDNGWLHVEADPDLVFSSDLETKYNRALFCLGIDPSHLVGDAGHA